MKNKMAILSFLILGLGAPQGWCGAESHPKISRDKASSQSSQGAAVAASIQGKYKILRGPLDRKVQDFLKTLKDREKIDAQKQVKLYDMLLNQSIQEAVLLIEALKSDTLKDAFGESVGVLAQTNEGKLKVEDVKAGEVFSSKGEAVEKMAARALGRALTEKERSEVKTVGEQKVNQIKSLTEGKRKLREEFVKSSVSLYDQLVVKAYLQNVAKKQGDISEADLKTEIEKHKDMKSVALQVVAAKNKEAAERIEQAVKTGGSQAEAQFKTLSQEYGLASKDGKKYQEIYRPLVLLDDSFRQLITDMNPGDLKRIPDSDGTIILIRLKSKTVPTDAETVKDYAKKTLAREKLMKFMTSVIKSADVKVTDSKGNEKPFNADEMSSGEQGPFSATIQGKYKISDAYLTEKVNGFLKTVKSGTEVTEKERNKLKSMLLQKEIQEKVVWMQAIQSSFLQSADLENLLMSFQDEEGITQEDIQPGKVFSDVKAIEKFGSSLFGRKITDAERAALENAMKKFAEHVASLNQEEQDLRKTFLKIYRDKVKQLAVRFYIQSVMQLLEKVSEKDLQSEVEKYKDIKSVSFQTMTVKNKETSARIEKAIHNSGARAETQFKVLAQEHGILEKGGRKYQEIQRPLVVLDDSFRKMVAGMNPGDVRSLPDDREGGVVMIRMKSKTLPTPVEAIADYARKMLVRDRINKFMVSLMKSSNVKVFDEKGKEKPFNPEE